MKVKIRVVYFQRKPRKAGNFSIESYFENLRKFLPTRMQASVLISRFESNGFFKRFYNALEAVFRQADINHITGDVHFLAIFLRKRKTILTVHDVAFIENAFGLKRKILQFFWLTLPARKVAYITTVSLSTKNQLLKFIPFFPPDKIFVIPVFIGSIFQPYPKPFNKEKPVILQLGTAFNKNIPRLAQALQGINCQLNIIGVVSEDLHQVLKKYEISYSVFMYLSEAEVLEQYMNCDIVALISTYEGFGMPIVEANAVERPIITSNLLSMPEVAAGAACLTNPYDCDEMRKSILLVIENDSYRQELIENGRKNKLRFMPESIVGSYMEVYEKIIRQL
jgi:glycosyltransferase involved in cell wall biosynthesis